MPKKINREQTEKDKYFLKRFGDLPVELQEELLLEMDPQTKYAICNSSKEIKKWCDKRKITYDTLKEASKELVFDAKLLYPYYKSLNDAIAAAAYLDYIYKGTIEEIELLQEEYYLPKEFGIKSNLKNIVNFDDIYKKDAYKKYVSKERTKGVHLALNTPLKDMRTFEKYMKKFILYTTNFSVKQIKDIHPERGVISAIDKAIKKGYKKKTSSISN